MYLLSFILLSFCLLALYRSRFFCSKSYSASLSLCPFGVSVTASLKGWMAVAIVLHHVESHLFLGKYLWYGQMANWGLWIVSLFFFITGYGLQFSILHKGKSYLNGFFRRRIVKIILPLLVATLGYLLFIYLINKEIRIDLGGKTPLLNSWFAYTVVVYYVAFYFIQKYTDKPVWAHGLMGGFTLLYVWVMAQVLHFPPYWYLTSYGVNLGMLAQQYEKQIQAFILLHTVQCWLGAVGLCGLYCLAAYVGLPGQSLLWGLSLPFLMLFLVYLGAFKGGAFSSWLGKYSYEIYLVHGTLFGLYPQFPLKGPVGDGCFVGCLLLFTGLLAFALRKLCSLLQPS